ncbi:hypothetical protein LUZ60_006756 [Juncus effusus]|nr:hypothetical protein LUZ60_006756 [Juncus effusus]
MAAAGLIRRVSAQIAHTPRPPLIPFAASIESPAIFSLDLPSETPSLPRLPSSEASMELMAVPKKKISKHKRGLRNGPKALKPVPVIVRCLACGKVKLPHYYCCSGKRENDNSQ